MARMILQLVLLPTRRRWHVGLRRLLLLLLLLLFVAQLVAVHALSPSSTSSSSTTTTTHRNHHNNKNNNNPIRSLSKAAGESALQKVSFLGITMTDSEKCPQSQQYFGRTRSKTVGSVFEMADDYQGDDDTDTDTDNDETTTTLVVADAQDRKGGVFSTNKRKLDQTKKADRKEKQVWAALVNLEKDMQLLDRLAGQKPQLSAFEFTLLSSAVLSSVCSPLLLNGRLAEFISPSAAAFTAAIGIAAEYTGKVAVADGKEVAAASIQCAAEAEGFLANAERAKAITPLCVGVGATAATLALLVPVLLDSLGVGSNLQLVTEIYLLCPLVAVLAAAVAGLAVQEVRNFCNLAIGVGNRRFARSGLVGRSWLSSTEIIDRKSKGVANKWKTFCLSVLPAPVFGALIPGALPTKTIVVAALAAAESAFYLAQAEYILSRACDAVALKARSAAVCDTYANQGARSAAILPFTSALSGLCAAATAAIVELPFVEALAEAGTVTGTFLEICAVSAFPAFSALFAAAASVSKARCEVDAEAAMQAASTIALPYSSEEEDPILRPLLGVRELIRLTISNSIKEPFRRFLRRLNIKRRFRVVRKFFNRQIIMQNSRAKDNNNSSVSK